MWNFLGSITNASDLQKQGPGELEVYDVLCIPPNLPIEPRIRLLPLKLSKRLSNPLTIPDINNLILRISKLILLAERIVNVHDFSDVDTPKTPINLKEMKDVGPQNDDNFIKDYNVWSILLTAIQLIELVNRHLPHLLPNHKQFSDILYEEAIRLMNALLGVIEKSYVDVLWLGNILGYMEAYLSQRIECTYWNESLIGGVVIQAIADTNDGHQEFLSLIATSIKLLDLIVNVPMSQNAQVSSLTVIGICIFHDINAAVNYLTSCSSTGSLFKVIKELDDNTSYLTSHFISQLLACHILDVLCTISTEFTTFHSENVLETARKFVSWIHQVNWKNEEIEEDENSIPTQLLNQKQPEFAISKKFREPYSPDDFIQWVITSPEYDYHASNLHIRIFINYTILAISSCTTTDYFKKLEFVFFNADGVLKHIEFEFLLMLHLLIDKYPDLVAHQLYTSGKPCSIWDWVLLKATSKCGAGTQGAAYLLCAKIILNLQEECSSLILRFLHLIKENDSMNEYALKKLTGLTIYVMDTKGAMIDMESSKLILDELQSIIESATESQFNDDLLDLIKAIISYFNHTTPILMKQLIEILFDSSSKIPLISILDLIFTLQSELSLHSTHSDVLLYFYQMIFNTIRDSKTSAIPTIGLLLISGLNHFFKTGKFSTGFAQSLASINFFDLLLNFMESLSLNQSEFFPPLLELLCSIIHNNDILLRSFADIFGFKKCIQLFSKSDMPFAAYYTGILYKSLSNGFKEIVHSQGLIALIELPPDVPLDQFIIIWNDVVQLCQISNFKNLEKCRKARLFRWMLENLEIFVDHRLLPEAIDFMITLLQYHANFEDVKLLVSQLKANETHIPWKHDLILQIMKKATDYRLKVSQSDFFIFLTNESKFLIPSIPSTFETITNGYTFTIGLNFHDWNLQSRPNVDVVIATLSWSEVVCHTSIIMKNKSLFLEFKSNDELISVEVVDFQFKMETWYTIIYTHQVGMFNVSNEVLYINGKPMWKGTFPYPTADYDMDLGIGLSTGQDVFPAYISSFALFNLAIPLEIVQTLHLNKEVSLTIGSELYGFQLLTSYQQPIVFCHPLGIKDVNTIYNISSKDDPFVSTGIPIVKIVPVSTRSFSDALQSAGSLEILFPLLTQIGIPVVLHNDAAVQRYILTQQERVVQILLLINSIIAQSPFHRNRYIRTKGPKLVSLLLQQISPEYLSTGVFDAIQELRLIGGSTPGFVKMIDDHILFEPQIWSRVNTQLQTLYFEKVSGLNKVFPDISVTTQQLSFWMDSVEQFYIRDTKAPWEYIRNLTYYICTNSDAPRFSESLWCCIHSPDGVILYQIFEQLQFHNPKFYQAILDLNGVELIFRLLQSVHESVRLTGLSLLEGIIINDSGTNAKLRKAMLDVKPGVWVKVLSQFPFTSSTYYKLLSITFDTILKLTGDSIYIDISKISKTLEIKRTDFLKVILDILGTAETIDAHVEVRIHHDLQYLLTSSISLARQVRDSASLHSIMEYLRRYLSTEREPITQHIQNLIQILVLLTLGGKEADQLLTNVMSDILTACLLLFPQQTGMHIIRQFLDILMSRLKVLILRNLGDDEQQRILDGLNIIDEIFFYHKDIFLALETEYGFALQNFNALMEIADAMPPSKSRRPSVSPDMVFQPCYPFDEWTELAVKYSRLIESVLRSNIVKQQKFSLFPFQQRQDSLIVLAVRIILASLTNCDRPTWNITLMQLSDMMDEGDFSKEALSQKFAYYILGSLYDASLLGSEILVYPAILQALELWGRLLIGSEKSLDRETLEKATSSLFDLEEFLKSEVWLNIYNNHLYHATRSVENEWIASVVPIVRRYKAVAHFLLTSTSRELQAVDSSEVSAMERLNREATVKAEIRKKRLSDRLCDYELDNRELTKIWHFCAQEVMYDGRIWSNAKLTQFYKLDITENSLRMRLRLAPHSDGEDHEIASQKRDQRRGSVVAKTQAPFQSLPDRKKILFKRLQTLQLDTGLVSEESLTHNDETIRIALEVNPDEDSTTGYDSQIETCLLSIECEIILYLTSVRGRIEVTTSHLRFFPDIVPQQKDAMTPITTTASSSVMVHLQELRIFAEHKRPLTELTNVFFRRYKMRNSAIEAFFNDGQNFFFSFFGNEQEADTIRKSLVNLLLKIPNMSFNCFNSSNLSVSLAKSDYTNRWIRREISNFEYLMALNTFSGRSYNDLTQYPVFPWILSDYTSKKLDLKDPSIYRDLSKPIGALTESRLQYFLERYKSFEDPSGEIEKFLYGSHYSSSVSVMFYLIRLEPFTSFHISLQGGKFDHADRQFHSMASLWKGVTTSTSDVKELIPEFFYLPEFLRNMNGFDLGKTQSGDMLNDVVLPPWASTPEDFIRIHRDALESDYVSDNLHHWIDLIWGYKQRGEQAVLAHNVFYYLTYEGSVNLDLIVDPMERKSIEDQIHHFGQTPSQLFNIPHPKRDPSPTTTSQDLSYSISSTNLGGNFDPACIFLISNTHFNHIFLANLGIKVLQYKYISSISSEGIKSVGVDFMNNVESRGMNNIQFSSFVKPHDQVMALTPNGKHLFVSGVFDYSFKLFNIEGTALRFVDRVFEHLDVVTCLCLSSTGEWLVTGSRDTTVRLWKIRYMNDRCVVTRGAMKIFYGHHEPVTSVLVNSENQIIVSASDDGKILVHPLHHSMSPITINPRIIYPHCSILKLCHFPIDGALLVLCPTNNCESKLLKYSINGRLLKNEAVGTVIDTAAVSNSGKYIYLAIQNGLRVLDGESFSTVIDCPIEGSQETKKVMSIVAKATEESVCIAYEGKLHVVSLSR